MAFHKVSRRSLMVSFTKETREEEKSAKAPVAVFLMCFIRIRYVLRISKSLVCALYSDGVISTVSQTITCFQASGSAFHIAAAPSFNAFHFLV